VVLDLIPQGDFSTSFQSKPKTLCDAMLKQFILSVPYKMEGPGGRGMQASSMDQTQLGTEDQMI
jgi:hypothetical protein